MSKKRHFNDAVDNGDDFSMTEFKHDEYSRITHQDMSKRQRHTGSFQKALVQERLLREASDQNSHANSGNPQDFQKQPADKVDNTDEYPVKKRKYKMESNSNRTAADEAEMIPESISERIASLCQQLGDHVDKSTVVGLLKHALEAQAHVYELRLTHQQDAFEAYARDAFKQHNCRDEYRLTYIS
jgi:hypothetical protein